MGGEMLTVDVAGVTGVKLGLFPEMATGIAGGGCGDGMGG